jgi:hypothetical protein
VGLHLPIPTDRTVSGPKLIMEGERLTVDYDHERDDGQLEAGRIVFEGVLSFEYCDDSCTLAENVLPPTEIRVLDQSEYLVHVRRRWETAVGWQDWQQQQGGADRFRHFTIYFDDVGSLDVVAASCQFDQ